MLYLDWHKTLVTLLSGGSTGRAPALDDETKALRFLANMWMPEQTQVVLFRDDIRTVLHGERPLISAQSPQLTGFTLPSKGVVVEDSRSAVGLVDLRNGQSGLEVPRPFVLIECTALTVEDVELASEAGTLVSLLSAFSGPLAPSAERFVSVWGMLTCIRPRAGPSMPMDIESQPWGVAIFDSDSVQQILLAPSFVCHLNGQKMAGVDNTKSEMWRWYLAHGASVVQNLSAAVLQIAYANSLDGTKS